MEQLILHLFGDYVSQSDWMAQNKTKCFTPAAVHAVVYSLPFLLLRPSWIAFVVILVTHFLIDRYRVARMVTYSKNVWGDPACWKAFKDIFVSSYGQKRDVHDASAEVYMGPVADKYSTPTGYPAESPSFLAVWLLIAADNTMHLAINYLALRFL